jgi:hypothetical protein
MSIDRLLTPADICPWRGQKRRLFTSTQTANRQIIDTTRRNKAKTFETAAAKGTASTGYSLASRVLCVRGAEEAIHGAMMAAAELLRDDKGQFKPSIDEVLARIGEPDGRENEWVNTPPVEPSRTRRTGRTQRQSRDRRRRARVVPVLVRHICGCRAWCSLFIPLPPRASDIGSVCTCARRPWFSNLNHGVMEPGNALVLRAQMRNALTDGCRCDKYQHNVRSSPKSEWRSGSVVGP